MPPASRSPWPPAALTRAAPGQAEALDEQSPPPPVVVQSTEVAPRREFIEKNAIYANIDI